jgi:hypothetical protein
MGSFDSLSLIGDLWMAFERNITSLGGFWFDVVTSMLWSYLDYQAYQVCTCEAPNLHDTKKLFGCISYTFFSKLASKVWIRLSA